MNPRLYRYRLPLLRPFPRTTHSHATGFIVAIGDRFGEVADAAIGDGDLEGCHSVLDTESRFSDLRWIPYQVRNDKDIETQLKHAVAHNGACHQDYCAPVKWALSALSDNHQPAGTLPLNALLDASLPDVVDEAMAKHTEGFRCFKIKIGDGAIQDEIARINELTKVLGKGISLRLDGNRKLCLSLTVEYARALKKAPIAYFEEPFPDLNDIPEFFSLTGFKIALDETLCESDFETWCDHEAVSAYVLKPSRIGALADVNQIVETAKRFGKACVWSSTFETGVGLLNLARVALSHGPRLSPSGLATGSYFAADLLTPPLRPFRGQLVVGATLTPMLDDSPCCERLV